MRSSDNWFNNYEIMQSRDYRVVQHAIANEIFQSSIAPMKSEELVMLEPIHLEKTAIARARELID